MWPDRRCRRNPHCTVSTEYPASSPCMSCRADPKCLHNHMTLRAPYVPYHIHQMVFVHHHQCRFCTFPAYCGQSVSHHVRPWPARPQCLHDRPTAHTHVRPMVGRHGPSSVHDDHIVSRTYLWLAMLAVRTSIVGPLRESKSVATRPALCTCAIIGMRQSNYVATEILIVLI